MKIEIFIQILSIIGIGGIVTVLVNHFLSGGSISRNKRKQILKETMNNVEIIQKQGTEIVSFIKEISQLEKEIVLLKENKDNLEQRISNLKNRYNNLVKAIKSYKLTCNDEELKRLEEQLSIMRIKLNNIGND